MKHFVLACSLFALVPASASAQESALEALRAAVSSAPRDYDAQHALGRALLEAGRFREASTVLRRASRLRRDDPAAAYEAVRVLFAQRDHRRARQQCRAIQRIARESPVAHVCQARAFLAWSRSARAFEEIEAALALAPEDFEALLALGDAHRLRGSVAEAEAAYRRAIAANPRSAEPHLGLGQTFARAHRPADALAALRRAHELDSDDPDIDYELGRASSGAEAVTRLGEAVSNRPGWALARAALGDALLETGDAEGAVREYREALGQDEHLAGARSGLGRALMVGGSLEEAEAMLRGALERVPNDQASAMALADVFARTDRVEEAYRQYRHAADLDRRDPEPLVRAARLAMTQERPVLATGFLQRAIAIDPNHAGALAMMGDVMRGRSQARQAREYYQRALRGQGVDREAVQRALRELR